jgi:BlaI family transcriptional regulator, penicillinase repressor
MPTPPRISESEWLVMNELWRKSPQNAAEVIAALKDQRDWGAATVKTLLSRLVTKGALGFTKQGREYNYFPKVAREQCVQAESRSFMDRVFGGAVTPMLAAFLEREPLSREDLQALRRLLDEKEEGRDVSR